MVTTPSYIHVCTAGEHFVAAPKGGVGIGHQPTAVIKTRKQLLLPIRTAGELQAAVPGGGAGGQQDHHRGAAQQPRQHARRRRPGRAGRLRKSQGVVEEMSGLLHSRTRRSRARVRRPWNVKDSCLWSGARSAVARRLQAPWLLHAGGGRVCMSL